MGGLMALYGAVCFNDWFSKAACVSSTISPCMAPLRRDIKKANIQEDTRIYLSFGTEEAFRPHPTDPLKSRTALQNLTIQQDLRKYGVATDFFCQVGGGHNEASWEKQIPRFMHFLWQ
jgi:enterochelin esterase-like enzyme